MILNGTVQLVSQASKQQLGLASAVPEIDTDEGRPPMSGPCRNNVYIRASDRDKHVYLIITLGSITSRGLLSYFECGRWCGRWLRCIVLGTLVEGWSPDFIGWRLSLE